MYIYVISFIATLLFCEDQSWVRKMGANFDVTMGSFDVAEVCELVGIFLLNQLTNLFDKGDVGLYYDDGLAIIRNPTGPITGKCGRMSNIFFESTI